MAAITRSPRFAWFTAVAALHALVVLALVNTVGHFPGRSVEPESLVTIFIRPAIHDDDGTPPGPDLSMLVVSADTPLQNLNVPAPTIAFDTSRNAGAIVAAPSLKPDNAVSLQPYIAQASLLPGEGATVVLRVEVLATGEPGRIEIDASSGSRQVDQAAIDYARQQRWYAGRVGDDPQSMWIRWGVRLQA